MKKIISLILVLMLVASLSVTAFADGEPATGSITINGVSTSTTYKIYKLLDLESYNTKEAAYSYKVNEKWRAFFNTDGAKAYFTIGENDYITWTWTADPSANPPISEEEAVVNFSKLALDYAKKNSIAPEKYYDSTHTTDMIITGTAGKFSGLELGYYLVDSSMGALCGLTTTNPDASINAKNGVPTVDKQVKEDSTTQWGAESTADIGQIVEYRVTINVHAGAEKYVLHDTMGDGLTFQRVVKIGHVVPGVETHDMDKKYYTVKTGSEVSDGCDFEVHFSDELCSKLQTNDKLVLYYEAMLNRNAVTAADGNKNTAWLTFGDNGESNHDEVTTHTYEIDIVKTDSQNTLIDGAQFKIYTTLTGDTATLENGQTVSTYVPVVKLYESDDVTPVLDKNGNPMYRRARSEEESKSGPIEVKDGIVTIVGLDNGTYYLQETKAPDGFNELTTRQKFIVSDENLKATFNGDIYSTGSGVHVVNKKGSILPETGAMGTMLFITFGTVVVMATGVLLVTKKRMSMIEE